MALPLSSARSEVSYGLTVHALAGASCNDDLAWPLRPGALGGSFRTRITVDVFRANGGPAEVVVSSNDRGLFVDGDTSSLADGAPDAVGSGVATLIELVADATARAVDDYPYTVLTFSRHPGGGHVTLAYGESYNNCYKVFVRLGADYDPAYDRMVAVAGTDVLITGSMPDPDPVAVADALARVRRVVSELDAVPVEV